jgi:hypothetical protein
LARAHSSPRQNIRNRDFQLSSFFLKLFSVCLGHPLTKISLARAHSSPRQNIRNRVLKLFSAGLKGQRFFVAQTKTGGG